MGCSTQFKDATQLFMEQIDVIKRLVEKYPNDMAFVTTAAGTFSITVRTVFKAHTLLETPPRFEAPPYLVTYLVNAFTKNP